MIVDKLLQEELKMQAREINGSERLYLELYQVVDILENYKQQQQVSVEPEVRTQIVYKTIDDEIALYEQYIDKFYTVDGKLKPCNPDAIFNWFKYKLWVVKSNNNFINKEWK